VTNTTKSVVVDREIDKKPSDSEPPRIRPLLCQMADKLKGMSEPAANRCPASGYFLRLVLAQFGSDYVDLFDGGRLGKQFSGFLHQGGG